MGATNSRLGNR